MRSCVSSRARVRCDRSWSDEPRCWESRRGPGSWAASHPLAICYGHYMFVFPSLWEGLGVAALEAAASGVATIASRAGGIAEVVRDGETGVLVAPADFRALRDAIARLAACAGERKALSEAARKRVVAEFAMGAMARGTMALYRACLGARKDQT